MAGGPPVAIAPFQALATVGARFNVRFRSGLRRGPKKSLRIYERDR